MISKVFFGASLLLFASGVLADGIVDEVDINIGGIDVICEYSTGSIMSENVTAADFDINSTTPIYIGGERYQLSYGDFEKLYNRRKLTCPGLPPIYQNKYYGYRLSIPVHSDYGQELLFDIAGESSRDMTLNVSCGSFSASDFGNKYYISQRAITGGTCNRLEIEFSHEPSILTPRNLVLGVTIAEEF